MYSDAMNRSQALRAIVSNLVFLISVCGYFQGIYIIFVQGHQPDNPILMLPYFVFGIFAWFLAKDKYPKNRNIAKRILWFFPLLLSGFFIPYYLCLKKKEVS